MRWKRTGPSTQIEDRRGMGGGGGFGFPMGRAAGGGFGLVGLILAVLFGTNIVGGGGGGFDGGSGLDPFDQRTGSGGGRAIDAAPDPDAQLADFVTFVVEDVQASWEQQFRAAGKAYPTTTLVLFEEATQSGCGPASSATGPFYCPADSKVYLDLGFFRELSDRFGAPGDFAQAYVIAHEFGHHVQNVLGINERVRREQQRQPDEANQLSVRLELQADCLAGVWANSAYEDDLLESGDLEEGLEAAAAVGDDRIQHQAGRRVDPHSFTHGTSEQRASWFKKGFERGQPDSCDTFS